MDICGLKTVLTYAKHLINVILFRTFIVLLMVELEMLLMVDVKVPFRHMTWIRCHVQNRGLFR